MCREDVIVMLDADGSTVVIVGFRLATVVTILKAGAILFTEFS